MVEVETPTASEPRQASFLPEAITSSTLISTGGRAVGKDGVSALEVYRVFRDHELGDGTARGVRKMLEAIRGRKVAGPSLNAAIHRLNTSGFIHVTTPDRERFRSYRVTDKMSDERFLVEYRAANQSA